MVLVSSYIFYLETMVYILFELYCKSYLLKQPITNNLPMYASEKIIYLPRCLYLYYFNVLEFISIRGISFTNLGIINILLF
jgi:hypothetical protein